MKPIIFSGPMVRAILDGRKTQTRRVCKLQPQIVDKEPRFEKHTWAFWHDDDERMRNGLVVRCPYGALGDELWVKEEVAFVIGHGGYIAGDVTINYRVDGTQRFLKKDDIDAYQNLSNLHEKWRRARFMPRFACRLFPTITDIRVERLQDISGNDAAHEGVSLDGDQDPCDENLISAFHGLWDSINGKKHPWSDNDWVWVVEFQRQEAD